MLRLTSKITKAFSQNLKILSSTNDISNMAGFINAGNKPTLTFAEKLSYFNPVEIYNNFDVISRQVLFTLSNEYQLGLPSSVIILSFVLRLSFFYPNIKAQMNAIKMSEIKGHLQKFKDKMRMAQMTRNMPLMKAAKTQFSQVQRKRGIDNFYSFFSILQVPFLISWFLSLRYIASLEQVHPSVTQGFLWVTDLSKHDPYFILPLVSALLTSYSIVISPAFRNSNTLPLLEPFIKYMKYLPILSLTVTSFFPAIINLYWATIAVNQTMLMLALNSPYIQNMIAKSKQREPQPQIIRAVFVQQKINEKENEKEKVEKSENKSIETKAGQIRMDKNIETLKILTKKPKKPKKQ